MPFEVFQPTSDHDAIMLLAASPMPFGTPAQPSARTHVDSPTQRRSRTPEHLERVFAAGRRRPEWVWGVRDAEGKLVASVAALSAGPGLVLDHFGGTDPDALAMALRVATSAARSATEAEASLFVPPGLTSASPELSSLTGALRDSGWRHLVDRFHYEFTPTPDIVDAAREVCAHGSLHLEPLSGPDDPRLLPLHRQVLDETLDAFDRQVIEREGLDAATTASLAELLDEDPWDCLHLAFDDAWGTSPVGYASWRAMSSGTGYLLLVGVARAARGHGYGTELAARATVALADAGCTLLVADTDVTNAPMASAFDRLGWPVTEARIDFVLS